MCWRRLTTVGVSLGLLMAFWTAGCGEAQEGDKAGPQQPAADDARGAGLRTGAEAKKALNGAAEALATTTFRINVSLGSEQATGVIDPPGRDAQGQLTVPMAKGEQLSAELRTINDVTFIKVAPGGALLAPPFWLSVKREQMGPASLLRMLATDDPGRAKRFIRDLGEVTEDRAGHFSGTLDYSSQLDSGKLTPEQKAKIRSLAGAVPIDAAVTEDGRLSSLKVDLGKVMTALAGPEVGATSTIDISYSDFGTAVSVHRPEGRFAPIPPALLNLLTGEE